MKKIAAITVTLGLGLLLAAGAWAYGGWGGYGGMMYGNGYGGGMMNGYSGPGWHMGYGAPAVATQDQSTDQGQAWGNAYCPGLGYGQQGYYPGAAPNSGPNTPNSQLGAQN